MLKIEFWIVRKGDDPWKMAPHVGDAISGHPEHGKCLFCGQRPGDRRRKSAKACLQRNQSRAGA
jgi:hypothetical protein